MALTAEETGLVVSAMLKLAEQGDHEGMARLVELADDPEKLRAFLAADDDEDDED